jgi:hypothetical protein
MTAVRELVFKHLSNLVPKNKVTPPEVYCLFPQHSRGDIAVVNNKKRSAFRRSVVQIGLTSESELDQQRDRNAIFVLAKIRRPARHE